MISRNFFVKCVSVERTLANIYGYWEDNAGFSEERRAMWKKLRQDEEGHALDLELASRIAVKDEQVQSAVSVADLESLLEHVTKVFALIQQHPLTDEQTVKLAVELEVKTMRVHARSALEFSDKELNRVFRSLGVYDSSHLAELSTVYRQLFNQEPAMMLATNNAPST